MCVCKRSYVRANVSVLRLLSAISLLPTVQRKADRWSGHSRLASTWSLSREPRMEFGPVQTHRRGLGRPRPDPPRKQVAPRKEKPANPWGTQRPLTPRAAMGFYPFSGAHPSLPVLPASQASSVAKRGAPEGPTSWRCRRDSCAKAHRGREGIPRGENRSAEIGCRRRGQERPSRRRGESPVHAAGSGLCQGPLRLCEANPEGGAERR